MLADVQLYEHRVSNKQSTACHMITFASVFTTYTSDLSNSYSINSEYPQIIHMYKTYSIMLF